jgi:L-ascorbate metabolism protein UlaG (beta-lactamase superfamily)
MLELGYSSSNDSFSPGYRIYISGDTIIVPELSEIPKRYTDAQKPIDLMLTHLGGTTIPSPALSPMTVMVTMDAQQGLELVRMRRPDITVPIHFDDYDVMASGLEEFQKAIEDAGLTEKVVYLDRGDKYSFKVRG